MPKVDFSDVEAKNFQPVPDGQYRLQLVKAEYIAKSKSGGLPMYKATFQVDDDDAGENDDANIFHNWSLAPNALWRFKQEAVILGCDPAIFDEKDADGKVILDTDDVIKEIMGNHCIADVKVDEYEPGKFSNKITRMQEAEVGATA